MMEVETNQPDAVMSEKPAAEVLEQDVIKTRELEKPLEYGDFIVLYANHDAIFSLTLEKNAILNNKFGNFHHEDIVGKVYGSQVACRSHGGYMYVLKPTPSLVTLSVRHRTQIVYHTDINLALFLLDAKPGKRYVEAGTGSGSVSTSLATAIRPGRLFSCEYHEERKWEAEMDFKKYGLNDVIKMFHRDVCTDGFLPEITDLDGAFFDLPKPWLAIENIHDRLKPGARVVTFSPCIEQVQKNVAKFATLGYLDIQTYENLSKPWAVKPYGFKKNNQKSEAEKEDPSKGRIVSYQLPMRGHTSYLTVATKPPSDEANQPE